MIAQELVDNSINEIKEYLHSIESKISEDEGEAQIMMNQAFLDGAKSVSSLSISKLKIIREANLQRDYQAPPKELAEYKAEVLKDIRKTVRSRFNTLLTSMENQKDKSNLQQELMRLDKELVGQIASIRHELPANSTNCLLHQKTMVRRLMDL